MSSQVGVFIESVVAYYLCISFHYLFVVGMWWQWYFCVDYTLMSKLCVAGLLET